MSSKKHEVLLRGQSSICWRPEGGPSALYFSLLDYQVFYKIAKTVHLEDYRQLQEQQCITPKKLHSRTKSYLMLREKDISITWYGVVNPKEESNFYGNVSFVLDICQLMTYCRPSFNIYFVEVIDFETSSATRILFTRKNYEYLKKYDPYVFGGPWHIDPVERHYWLQNARRFDGKTNPFGHRLEFMLEFEEGDAKWLYDHSVAMPVDHHEANSGKKRKCLKYGINGPCPSPHKKERTKELMKPPESTQRNGEEEEEDPPLPGPSGSPNGLTQSQGSLDQSDRVTETQENSPEGVRRRLVQNF